MNLKDMTDLIRIYDAYAELAKRSDDPEMDEIRLVEEVIMRNSVLYQRDCNDVSFDLSQSEHMDVLCDRRLTATQRAFRILGICNEA